MTHCRLTCGRYRAVPARLAAAALVTVGLLASGCGRAPELPTPAVASVPAARPTTATPPPPSRVPPAPVGSASPSGFGEAVAVPCGGRPGPDEILSVLRARGLTGAGPAPTVRTGPLCAGTWQYAVVVQSGREPLQVVTRRAAGGLALVTAGTDVCSVEVRVNAPAGILAAARCG